MQGFGDVELPKAVETSNIPPEAGFAGKIIAECGIILKPLNAVGSQFHAIECDQTDFIRKCERKLKYDFNF